MNNKTDKLHRKSISLETKVNILKRLDQGAKQVDVCRSFGLAGSTVRSIIKNKKNILDAAKTIIPLDAKKLCKTRPKIMVEMERLLNIFIAENTQRRIPVNFLIIRHKALSLYEELKKNIPRQSDSETFTASKGWFERFKKRSNLHNIASSGEAASADQEAADSFKITLSQVIEEGGYTADQVFNVDETGLFWKRMPKRTFISKEEKTMPGFKVSKDRLTLMLGGNASGTFKLKPLLVYHSQNPRALKGVPKERLSVVWKSNRKAWVTRQTFEEWYVEYFCPAVKKFCFDNNLSHKILLLLDNAPGHPSKETLEALDEHIQILYLPPNTTSVLQPMDQGLIATFKAYYLRKTFSKAIEVTNDREKVVTLREFWRSFNIKDAIDHISYAWNEVEGKTLNRVWRKVWPECVKPEIEEPLVETVEEDIVKMGRAVGLNELTKEDIHELIDTESELTTQDLIELGKEQEKTVEVESEEEDEEVPVRNMTAKGLAEAFGYLDKVCTYFKENDNDLERSLKVGRDLEKAVSCYKELYNEKKKATQLKMDQFIQKETRLGLVQPAARTNFSHSPMASTSFSQSSFSGICYSDSSNSDMEIQ